MTPPADRITRTLRACIGSFCRFDFRFGDYNAHPHLPCLVCDGVWTGDGGFLILKVSRTIADLEGEEVIRADHIGEALAYRAIESSQ